MDNLSNRVRKEIQKLKTHPPEGISCHLRENSLNVLDACIVGTKGTPYEGGTFHLEVSIPQKYPFIAPRVIFLTPIYHPNIDEGGRICLNILKMPPNGSWRCALTIEIMLTSIQALMSEPNPDDPLMPEIAEVFRNNRQLFEKTAREWTNKYCKSEITNLEKNSHEIDQIGTCSQAVESGSNGVKRPLGDDEFPSKKPKS